MDADESRDHLVYITPGTIWYLNVGKELTFKLVWFNWFIPGVIMERMHLTMEKL